LRKAFESVQSCGLVMLRKPVAFVQRQSESLCAIDGMRLPKFHECERLKPLDGTVLDRSVEHCYRTQPFESDRQRDEFLFALYEKLSARLNFPAKKGR
jgi:hypothetical protein